MIMNVTMRVRVCGFVRVGLVLVAALENNQFVSASTTSLSLNVLPRVQFSDA